MKKYTDRWLADHYCTELSIKTSKDAFADRIALSTQPKFITIVGVDELELFAPILAKYKFECEPYEIDIHLKITITK
jgi:hypothetical protein